MFLSYYILSSEDKGNWNLNGAGLRPSLSASFNDRHFAGEMTREKKEEEKEEKNVPTCLQNKAEKEAVRISVTCVPLRAMALFKFTCMCICKGLYSKTHTLFFARIMEYLFKICSFLIFFFFFYKEQKENKNYLKAKLNPKSGVCVCAFMLMCNNTVCTMAIFSWLELDYIVIYVGFSAFFVYFLNIC